MAMGTPGLYCNAASPLAARVAARCPSLASPAEAYEPPPLWGANGHAQTIAASLWRQTRAVTYARELLPTPDGGVLALDLLIAVDSAVAGKGVGTTIVPLDETRAAAERSEAPFLLLAAGLGGGSQDAYVRSMAAAAAECGWRVAVLNMRGCGGSAVVTPRLFSAHRGSTDDLRLAVAHARRCEHLAACAPAVAGVGWSNGATILNNALAEQATTHPPTERSAHALDAGASLACPLNMPAADANFQRIFNSAVYDRTIARSLVRTFAASGANAEFEKALAAHGRVPSWQGGGSFELDLVALMAADSIRGIDEQLTRRCFGFESVDAYYADASSDQRLPAVAVPLLVANAYDDPLAPGASLPYAAARASEHVLLALTAHGGHLGWCERAEPFGRPAWVERAVTEFLAAALELTEAQLRPGALEVRL
jgi:hypothetical protein